MAESRNICITINSLVSGGAEKQCLLLAKALKPYHNIIVVIFDARSIYPPHLSTIKKEGLVHLFLAKNPLKKAYEFTRLLKKRKIDIIFSFLPTDTVWAAIFGNVAKVPYIFGGIRSSYLPWIKHSILRLTHNNLLNYTITNNYSAYLSAIEFGFKNKVLVVPNGIEIRPFPKKRKRDTERITIISVGRLVKSKAYETSIKCIADLKKIIGENYTINYKIVGHGPEMASIITHIDKYDVREEVEIITSPSDIYGLLESSDIYLSTTTFEGISNALMEAMNCAMPLVVTDAGDNSRLVVNGKNGFLTAIHDYKDMARHLSYLIKTPKVRAQMGLNSYNHLVLNFSYETFQKKYLDLIENMEKIEIRSGEHFFEKK